MAIYYVPSINLMGAGCLNDLGATVNDLGFKKAFVVTDNFLMSNGVANKVLNVLEGAGIAYEVYSEVVPNPTCKNVHDGLERLKETDCDFLVSIGGGSPQDTAKAIGILATNGGHIKEYEGVNLSKNKSLPIVAVNTTAGTSSEVTINYVVTDEERHVKMVMVDKNSLATVTVNDPELMVEKPASLTAATGMDALTHALEGYITKAHNEMSDMFHIKAIQLIVANLAAAVNEKDKKAINIMGMAQYIAGMGFSNVGLGICHSMAHQLGAVYDTPHGIANAMLLPTVLEFNGEVCYERYQDILKALGYPAEKYTKEETIQTLVDIVRDLAEQVGITQTISDYGAKLEDLEMLSEKAMEDPCKPGNPREVDVEGFIKLYKKAM